MANVSAGIHIDRSHGFGLVEHQMPARFELYLAVQRFLDFIINTVQVKDGPFAGVVLQLAGQLGGELLDKFFSALECFA